MRTWEDNEANERDYFHWLQVCFSLIRLRIKDLVRWGCRFKLIDLLGPALMPLRWLLPVLPFPWVQRLPLLPSMLPPPHTHTHAPISDGSIGDLIETDKITPLLSRGLDSISILRGGLGNAAASEGGNTDKTIHIFGTPLGDDRIAYRAEMESFPHSTRADERHPAYQGPDDVCPKRLFTQKWIHIQTRMAVDGFELPLVFEETSTFLPWYERTGNYLHDHTVIVLRPTTEKFNYLMVNSFVEDKQRARSVLISRSSSCPSLCLCDWIFAP